jgi:hypothetical protein
MPTALQLYEQAVLRGGIRTGRAESLRDRAERAASDCMAGLGEQWVDEAEYLAASVASEDGSAKVRVTVSGHANVNRMRSSTWPPFSCWSAGLPPAAPFSDTL